MEKYFSLIIYNIVWLYNTNIGFSKYVSDYRELHTLNSKNASSSEGSFYSIGNYDNTSNPMTSFLFTGVEHPINETMGVKSDSRGRRDDNVGQNGDELDAAVLMASASSKLRRMKGNRSDDTMIFGNAHRELRKKSPGRLKRENTSLDGGSRYQFIETGITKDGDSSSAEEASHDASQGDDSRNMDDQSAGGEEVSEGSHGGGDESHANQTSNGESRHSDELHDNGGHEEERSTNKPETVRADPVRGEDSHNGGEREPQSERDSDNGHQEYRKAPQNSAGHNETDYPRREGDDWWHEDSSRGGKGRHSKGPEGENEKQPERGSRDEWDSKRGEPSSGKDFHDGERQADNADARPRRDVESRSESPASSSGRDEGASDGAREKGSSRQFSDESNKSKPIQKHGVQEPSSYHHKSRGVVFNKHRVGGKSTNAASLWHSWGDVKVLTDARSKQQKCIQPEKESSFSWYHVAAGSSILVVIVILALSIYDTSK